MATRRPLVLVDGGIRELTSSDVVIPSYIAEPISVSGSNDVRVYNDNSGEIIYADNGDVITGVVLVSTLFNFGG